LTDAELVSAAREKDSEAWKTLYQRYVPSVWRYAYALVNDVHQAEDIVGEVMLALLKGMNDLDAESSKISTWLRSVVRHKVADHHRRNYRSKDGLNQIWEKKAMDTTDTSPTAPLETEETQKQVLDVLDSLPERHRVALEWKYVEDLRVREIAQRWGETEKVVEATLYRARREFRRRFGLVELPSSPDIPSRKLPGSQAKIDSPLS
jgi:RNA polymerase sigma-70 factor (ECF subfamily)